MADELDKFQFDTNIATAVGSSVGIVGGAITVVGLSLALAPVTAGASVVLGLAIGGGVAGGAGAATSIGSFITRFHTNRKRRKEFIEMLNSHRTEMEQMQTMAKVLVEMYNSCREGYDSTVCSNLYRISHISREGLQRVVNNLGRVQTQLNDIHTAIWPDDGADSPKRELGEGLNILKPENLENARDIANLFKTIKLIISDLEDEGMYEETNEMDSMVLNKNGTRGAGHDNRHVLEEDLEAQRRQENDAEDTAGETEGDFGKANFDSEHIRLGATGTARLGTIGTTKAVSAGLQVRPTHLKGTRY